MSLSSLQIFSKSGFCFFSSALRSSLSAPVRNSRGSRGGIPYVVRYRFGRFAAGGLAFVPLGVCPDALTASPLLLLRGRTGGCAGVAGTEASVERKAVRPRSRVLVTRQHRASSVEGPAMFMLIEVPERLMEVGVV